MVPVSKLRLRLSLITPSIRRVLLADRGRYLVRPRNGVLASTNESIFTMCMTPSAARAASVRAAALMGTVTVAIGNIEMRRRNNVTFNSVAKVSANS